MSAPTECLDVEGVRGTTMGRPNARTIWAEVDGDVASARVDGDSVVTKMLP